MAGATLTVDGALSATLGAVDYDDEMFATMTAVAGELGSAIRPAG